jgi:hypothetical protein
MTNPTETITTLTSLAGALSYQDIFTQLDNRNDVLTASSDNLFRGYNLTVGTGAAAGNYFIVNNNNTTFGSEDILLRIPNGKTISTSDIEFANI